MEKPYNNVLICLENRSHEVLADGRNRYADKTDFFLKGLLVASVPNSCVVVYPDGWKEDLKVPSREIYSGVPNEHNLSEEDAEWYKNHIANQKEATDSVKEESAIGEAVKFWATVNGYVADTELFIKDELVSTSDGGETDVVTVLDSFYDDKNSQQTYSLSKDIRNDLTWYITKREFKGA